MAVQLFDFLMKSQQFYHNKLMLKTFLDRKGLNLNPNNLSALGDNVSFTSIWASSTVFKFIKVDIFIKKKN